MEADAVTIAYPSLYKGGEISIYKKVENIHVQEGLGADAGAITYLSLYKRAWRVDAVAIAYTRGCGLSVYKRVWRADAGCDRLFISIQGVWFIHI